MGLNLVNLFKTQTATPLAPTASKTAVSNNPFGNPFLASNGAQNSTSYAKNQPIQGGYFAGYYNGKPNIVGQRLFIEA